MGFGFILLSLRIIQALVAIVILGLSIYVANWYNSETLTASPSQINFLIFVSVWSLLTLPYLEFAPRYWPRGSHPLAHAALELTTPIFYLSGAAALAVFLANLLFCRGSVCTAARVDAGAAALGCALWAATAMVRGLQMRRGALDSGRRGLPTRRETTMVPGRFGA